MNASQPISSAIRGVGFGFLTSSEIKALSVKKITNPVTFDNLLNPNFGGLYDPALGARGEEPCGTCGLNQYGCPGHAGHIELPVPLYHAIFMDQVIRLLRAKCSYCHHFRLPRHEINYFCCKLKLIQKGHILAANELWDLTSTSNEPEKRKSGAEDSSDAEDSETNSQTAEDEDSYGTALIERQNEYTRKYLQTSGENRHVSEWSSIKNESLVEARRSCLKDLLKRFASTSKRCQTCKGISPTFRKDGTEKIFEKPLPIKVRANMVQSGHRATDPLVLLAKSRISTSKAPKPSNSPIDIDEGIADVVDITEEDVAIYEEEARIESLVEKEAESLERGDDSAEAFSSTERYVNSSEVLAALTLLFEKEYEILNIAYNPNGLSSSSEVFSPEIFFIRYLLVPPTKYRPESLTGANMVAENPQNTHYKQILNHCEAISQIYSEMTGRPRMRTENESESAAKRDLQDLQTVSIRLQATVNGLIDRDRGGNPAAMAVIADESIRHKLEKKDGLFRKNMMGKRVNFAARSVISPDPNIETNEVGIPPIFAKKLTFPEPVTSHNFLDLKEAVINGPAKWPGAVAIENENGQVINLRNKNQDERQALANQLLAPSTTDILGTRNKKVHRHLNNGDIVLMNRQPTLHKPSMMGHRAKVLQGEKTIRMHYVNCNAYNADFDGDEMNMHFPQNELARAETMQIADTDHQYLAATAGKPLRGLIQDHISMGVWITNKDTFFHREEYQQLLYSCLRPEDSHTTTGKILTVDPTIIKPKPLWTGKQIITSILMNIQPEDEDFDENLGLNFSSASSTNGDRWAVGSEEGTVRFQNGEMISGILDKAQLGPTAGGVVHSVYETYGHSVAGKFLSILSRLLTKFLNMRAFTCGMDDLFLTRESDLKRLDKLKQSASIGLEVASKYVTLDENSGSSTDPELLTRLEVVLRDDEKQLGLDTVLNAKANELSSSVTSTCLPNGLAKSFPWNQMQLMTTAGAKGSQVNANLISCNLGQQVLEGRRVPIMTSGKSLPSFRPFDTDIRAGGYVCDRFLTGIRPQEYYFHAMAGREGLIDTAVKTARSGYLQRCLVKGLEGLKIEYDTTVRDVDGVMTQFLYGEDGLEVSKAKHLSNFKFAAENARVQLNHIRNRKSIIDSSSKKAGKWNAKAIKKVKKSGEIDAMDPALAHFNPGCTLSSTSETFFRDVEQYIDSNPDDAIATKETKGDGFFSGSAFKTLMNLKYLKSVIEPGEAVGIVAAQSIGEPSTQMTLNTFHLAGHSAKNVTLGIPRLREIVMTASRQITTPLMTLHLIPELPDEEGQTFAKAITRLSLAEITDKVILSEKIGKGIGFEKAKIYDIEVRLFPTGEYEKEYAIASSDVAKTLEAKFLTSLTTAIKREVKKKNKEGDKSLAVDSDALPQIGESLRTVEEVSSGTYKGGGGDDEDDDDENAGDGDDDDGDATTAKRRQNQSEAISYDAPDEDEENIAARNEKEASPDIEMEDEGFGGSPEPSDDSDENMSDTESSRKSNSVFEREQRIKDKFSDVSRFLFDEKVGSVVKMQLEFSSELPKILMLPIIEKALHNSLIQSIDGLTACTHAKEKYRDPDSGSEAEVPVVLTTGVNLRAMHLYQEILNPNRIFTNDINAMLEVYGVEAARATIVREMDGVFSSHGISVDVRHLGLIADFMTRAGGFAPFSRNGMQYYSSPLSKMSFETTVAFMRDAVLEQDSDDLSNPSARLVIGKVGKVGTGGFDVMTPVSI